jgi:hypothetical protein
MRQNDKKPAMKIAPVHRAIKPPAPKPEPIEDPGQLGQAALNAAALHQLNRYAEDIQEFLNARQIETIIDGLQGDLEPPKPPQLRLRRE